MWEYPPPRGWNGTCSLLSMIFFLASKDITILGDPGAVSRVGKGQGRKFASTGKKSPCVRTLTELFPKIQADACSWLGTKNALYYCAQWANSFFWVRPIARNRRFWSLHGQNLISRTRGTSGHLEKFPTVLNKGNFTTKCGINKIICNTACCAMYLETSTRLRLKGWLI